MIKSGRAAALVSTVAGMALAPLVTLAHGDVAPQPVNTDALPDVGEEWLSENPYREMGDEVWAKAVEIGSSAYNSNCARCHGLEVVSGGLAPDLRYLTADWDGDEWFMERYINGYTQNGVTKMPAFGELLGQKAAWAIRTYVEARPDEGALDDYVDRLREIRDIAAEAQPSDSQKLQDLAGELLAINTLVPTASGAPLADSPALRAAHLLEKAEPGRAAEVLTVGLSSAE